MTFFVTLALIWVATSFVLGGAWAALRCAAQRPDVSDRIPAPRAAGADAAARHSVSASH